jgi:mono/diheme cytochrome c family protein
MRLSIRNAAASAALSFLAAACAAPPPADNGEAASAARGKAVAEAQCAQCHAIGTTGLSPYAPAPVWREMATTNDLDDLATRFSEGRLIHRPGPVAMPEFTFTPQEIADLIAYMKSLREG